jgi:shikimate dehydrogenase
VDRFALLGRGIQRSLSPALWNNVFARLGVDARFGLRDVEVDGLEAALKDLHDPDVGGYHVTTPYKAWAAAQAALRTGGVARAQVANWLCLHEGRIAAANSDVDAARALFAQAPHSERVLVLGAGGTAAAILVALEGRAGRVVLANRTHRRAVQLARRASAWLPVVTVIPWPERITEALRVDLVVNTTPLGMRDEQSPLSDLRPRDSARIYDVVYRARPTALHRQAARWGLPFADGLAHLEAQAVALLPRFGLAAADADVVRACLREVVGHEPNRWQVPDARS